MVDSNQQRLPQFFFKIEKWQIFSLYCTNSWRQTAKVSFLPFVIWHDIMLNLSIIHPAIIKTIEHPWESSIWGRVWRCAQLFSGYIWVSWNTTWVDNWRSKWPGKVQIITPNFYSKEYIYFSFQQTSPDRCWKEVTLQTVSTTVQMKL